MLSSTIRLCICVGAIQNRQTKQDAELTEWLYIGKWAGHVRAILVSKPSLSL